MSALVTIDTHQIEAIIGQIQAASSLTDLTEVRARIEAARAWAKVHGEVKRLRLDLLRVEVEALVRVVELGGVDMLSPRDRKPAQYLASLSLADRAALIEASGSAVTTAAGVVRACWADAAAQDEKRTRFNAGRGLANRPENVTDEVMQAWVRERTMRVSEVLGTVLEDAINDGQPFTVAEVADAVLDAASIGMDRNDPDVEAGIRDVCRRAIQRQPVVKIDGTILPRTITAPTETGATVRIPIENATLGHFAQMIEAREQQLLADESALSDLRRAYDRLRDLPGAGAESRIGGLLAADLIGAAS